LLVFSGRGAERRRESNVFFSGMKRPFFRLLERNSPHACRSSAILRGVTYLNTASHFGGHHTVFFRQQLPVDFLVFSVQVPRNENRSHRVKTTLRAMVEKLGASLLDLQTINDGKKMHLARQYILVLWPAIKEFDEVSKREKRLSMNLASVAITRSSSTMV
jgi:hypothetical protein